MGNFYMLDDDAFAYINLGTDATPVWTLMDNAEEFMMDVTKIEIELPIAASDFQLRRGGRFDAPVSFKYSRPKPGITDAVHDAIFDSFRQKTPIQFAWTDLAITDSAAIGLQLWCEVTKYPFKKALDAAQSLDIEAKPTDYEEGGVLIPPAYLIGS